MHQRSLVVQASMYPVKFLGACRELLFSLISRIDGLKFALSGIDEQGTKSS